MKRILMTAALTCVLSVSALAGEIPSVGLTSQPPEETTLTPSSTSPGDVPSVGSDTSEISNAVLNLIQSMFGLVV